MKKQNALGKQVDKFNDPSSHKRAKELAEQHKDKKVIKYLLK